MARSEAKVSIISVCYICYLTLFNVNVFQIRISKFDNDSALHYFSDVRGTTWWCDWGLPCNWKFWRLRFIQRSEVDFAHNQLGDTFGSDLTIQEGDEKKTSEFEGGNTTIKYIKITNTIQIPETESVKLIMNVLRVIWVAFLTGLTKGFMPTVERFRRDTSSHRGWRKFIN